MIGIKKIILTTVLFFGIAVVSFAQNRQLKQFDTAFESLDFNDRITALKKINPEALSANDKGNYYRLYAQTFYYNSKGDQALRYFMKSIEVYQKSGNLEKANEIKITVVEIKSLSDYYAYKDYQSLLEEVIAYAKKTNNTKLLRDTFKLKANCIIKEDTKKAINYYQLAIIENKKLKDTLFGSHLLNNIGLAYNEYLKKPEIARKYFKRVLPYYLKKKEIYYVAINYVNMASVMREENKLDSAIYYYKKADSLDVKKNRTNLKIILYTQMSNTYKELKEYESAFKYLEKQKVFENINDNKEITKAIRDIDAKYQTKENKLQISSLKDTLEKAGIALIVLLLALIVFFLGYQNLRRKKKIAEQEQLIQNQKLENILQEQELNEIDKLIEGQEKERIKIANELHDNMGSMLATIKLNFENLKLRKDRIEPEDEQLFDKTDSLLEEAYQKVRSIAHTQNAGVIGNEGLVPALFNIANKITIPGKLSVQVIPFGLNERLENSLELAIFRMIQELLTNAVKHAQATEITISLTQHENNLNIIIEDNGKGFNPKNRNKNEGMGLTHIEKKTEQLGGNFSIDSTEGRGTSILIDLPL
jgi:signal transduction histidine kinase